MKNSKTKKLLAIITLANMSFNANLVLACSPDRPSLNKPTNKLEKAKKDLLRNITPRTVVISGNGNCPNKITKETVQNIVEQHSATAENKISLVLMNCVVENEAFEHCNFINKLVVVDDVIIKKGSFSKTAITNVTVKIGATLKKNSFSGTTITNLTIEDGANIMEDSFSHAKITNLTVQKGATIMEDGFRDTKITGSAKYSNGNDIPYKTLLDYGIISSKLLQVVETYCEEHLSHDPKTNTITIDGNSSTAWVNESLARIIAEKYTASEKNKINLVLRNYSVVNLTFEECNFIDTLTIEDNVTIQYLDFSNAKKIPNLIVQNGVTVNTLSFFRIPIANLVVQKGAKLEKGNFSGTTIENLTIEDNVTIQYLGFSNAKIPNLIVQNGIRFNALSFFRIPITNLTVQKGASIEPNDFKGATITGSAKYSDGSDIPQETLKTWGFRL